MSGRTAGGQLWWRIRLEILRFVHARRGLLRLLARYTVAVSLIIFIGFSASDIIFSANTKAAHISFPAQPRALMHGNVAVSKLQLDLASHQISGDAVYEVQSSMPEPNIDVVQLSFQQAPDLSTVWFLHKKEKDLLQFSDNGLAGARVEQRASFRLEEIRRSVFYPFDAYAFDLNVRGCANTYVPPCDDAQHRIALTEVSVETSEPHFWISQELTERRYGSSRVRSVLQRPFFLRWVTIWIAALLFIFLLYLLHLSEPKDLLPKAAAYFGTMWAFRQLIVPSSISIFPTIMDYYILLLFAILFIVVTHRVVTHQLGGKS